jgi:septal ring factor EnvC (AmiA/AmiB activator)
MIRIITISLCFFIISVVFTVDLFGQNRAYYEKLKSNKKASIGYSKKLLDDLKSSQANGIDKLLIVKEQLAKQKEILNIVNKELQLIDTEIAQDSQTILRLEKEKESIKSEYARLIQFSYQNLSLQKRMIFVLSANSFNKAYRRMAYLKSLSDFRKSRFIQIENNIHERDSVIVVLKKKKESKVQLQGEKKAMVSSLEDRKHELNKYLAENKSEMNKVLSAVEVENKKKNEIKINVTRQIEKEEENKPVVVSNKITKLDGNLTSKFESKKSWHIWPLAKFVILHHYGDYSHPVFENVMVKNDGVELGASSGSNVHCIFEGKVINIVQIPGDGTSIIIKHGNYYSVYSKLNQILVNQGDIVSKGQVIAKLSKSEKIAKLNFQLWRGSEKLNPEVWLKRQ